MLILISPSKTQDFSDNNYTNLYTEPSFIDKTEILIKELRKKKVNDIAKLMDLSENLSLLNYQRYQQFATPFTIENAKQALLAFKGDVYTGFDLDGYSDKDFDFAQQHLRIISGLYGMLRPLDLIQPYRLEMKIRLKNPKGKDLYAFWGDKLSVHLNNELKEKNERVLINLASQEYFKAINTKALKAKVITPHFKEEKNGSYKIVALFAKKARGMMANFAIKNKIANPEHLKAFQEGGYSFQENMSSENDWVFVR
jgi:uncharacterized protein